MRETALPLAQSIFPRLEFLREPVTTVGTLSSIGNTFRVGEQLTQVLPDERVELLGRTITGLTALVMLGVERLDGTAAHIVAMAMLRRPREACGLTHATTDQGPQQIAMRCIVARGSLFIQCQFGLHPIEHLLAYECWNVRDERPRLGWGGVLAMGRFAERMRGGAPDTRRACVGPTDLEFACIRGVRQEPVKGGRTPTGLPSR